MQRTLEKNRGYWESFDDIDGLGHECRCLMEDRNGNIWIGILAHGGELTFDSKLGKGTTATLKLKAHHTATK